MSLRKFFLIKFWKILALYLGCGCVTFDFTTQMISSHLFTHVDESKTWVQRPQIHSKMLLKICKKEEEA